MKEDPADAGQMKLEGSNAINENCNHLFIKYPPLIGKIKTCLKCGILLAPGGIQGGYNTVRLSGNHVEMTVATAPANPSSGLVRMYATSATSVRMRDSAGTETDLAGAGALTRAGGNTTEGTTTSTTLVDLLSVSGLSIAVGTPVLFIASIRKTTGAANLSQFSVKLNATDLGGSVNTGSTNVATSGRFRYEFTYATTSYLRAGVLGVVTDDGGGNYAVVPSTDMPTATLTACVVEARSADAAITTGAEDGQVYTYAVS